MELSRFESLSIDELELVRFESLSIDELGHRRVRLDSLSTNELVWAGQVRKSFYKRTDLVREPFHRRTYLGWAGFFIDDLELG